MWRLVGPDKTTYPQSYFRPGGWTRTMAGVSVQTDTYFCGCPRKTMCLSQCGQRKTLGA